MGGQTATSDPEALGLYQQHLERMTAALLAGDLETFASGLSFPHFVTTATDTFCMENIEDLRLLFTDYYQSLQAECVTDLIRIAQSAQFVTPDEIKGTHISHKMRGAVRILAPYHNRIRLVRCADGNWRESHSANAVKNKAGRFGIVTGTSEGMTAPDLNAPSERKHQ